MRGLIHSDSSGQLMLMSVSKLTGWLGRPSSLAVSSLNAWIDFDKDGSWATQGDQIFTNVPLEEDLNYLSFTVADDVVPTTPTYARFRFSTYTVKSYDNEESPPITKDSRCQETGSPMVLIELRLADKSGMPVVLIKWRDSG